MPAASLGWEEIEQHERAGYPPAWPSQRSERLMQGFRGPRPMNQDLNHLKLLSIFHYVLGGLAGFFSCFPFIYIGLGALFAFSPQMAAGKGDAPPPGLGWIFIVLGTIGVLFLWTMAICLILAGRFLSARRHYLFCLVVAALSCLWVPFGTALGIFTIIVLIRPTVKGLFGRERIAAR